MKLIPASSAAVDDADAVVVVGVAPGAEHHRAEAERRHLDAGAAEWAVGHGPTTVANAISLTTDAARSLSSSTWLLRPLARAAVDHAQRAERVAAGVDQRDARVGDRAHLLDRRVVLEQRVLARVLDDQRRALRDRVLAEGVRERRLALARRRLLDADRALEELAVLVDQRDERDRGVEHLGGEPDVAVEAGVGRGVEQAGLAQRRQPRGVLDRGGGGEQRLAARGLLEQLGAPALGLGREPAGLVGAERGACAFSVPPPLVWPLVPSCATAS